MANAGPAGSLLDGVSAIFRSVSCGHVYTVPMRPGKGVENCLNTRDILAGVAEGAQPGRHRNLTKWVPYPMRTGPGMRHRLGTFGSVLSGINDAPTPARADVATTCNGVEEILLMLE